MSIKRYAPFILINIIVSAGVILGILYFWDRNQTEQQEIATATSVAATAPVATAAAIATASVPTEPPPTPEQVRHIVQAGETLGTIAEDYAVPWEDIARANKLINPDYLSVGDELIIPVGGIPTDTPEPSPSPTSSEPPTPIPTESPGEGEAKLVIREVIGVGDLANEAVVIANDGTRGIQLAKWELHDSQGNVYTFKPVFLYGEGVNVILYSKSGTDSTTALYWAMNVPVWESGETATLRDGDGTVRATYTIP